MSLSAQTRDALPVPDVPGFHTLKCDFHVHTVFSDGEVWPTTRVSEAWQQGLDVIALTDHAGYHPHDPDISKDLQRPYEIALTEARRSRITLIQGVEIAEGNLHCNALFVTKPNAFSGLKLLDALREANRQGAFVFWNHPGWKRKPDWFPLIASAYEEHLFQGVELVNDLDFYPEVFPWIEQRSLTIMADSDTHVPTSAQYSPRTRPITLLFAHGHDERAVREALESRRAAAWMGGQVWGAEQYLHGLWDGAIEIRSSDLEFHGGPARRATVQIRNRSAIPFRLRVADTPKWLLTGAGELPAERVAEISLALAKDAPAGTQQVVLELEVLNLHVSPNRNLIVRIPLNVAVRP
ncbi:MAG: PHP domain-containing protein [Bryobacteraceae bacterium]